MRKSVYAICEQKDASDQCLCCSLRRYTDRQKIPVREFNDNFFMLLVTPYTRSELTELLHMWSEHFFARACKLNIALQWRKRQTVISYFFLSYEYVSCFWTARIWTSSYERIMKIVSVLNADKKFSFSWLRLALRTNEWRIVGQSSRNTLGCVCFLCTLCHPARYGFC